MKIELGNGYALSFSEQNSKMGKINSFSVPPITTCWWGVPCVKDCYAVKYYNLHKRTENAYKSNMEAVLNVPIEELAKTFTGYINLMNVKYFRWNVSGDFNLPNYWRLTCLVAEQNPECNFMAFTKMYHLREMPRPSNFNLVLSIWKDYMPPVIDNRTGYAYFNDGTYPIPEDAVECDGKCDICHKCFFLTNGKKVYFNKH